MPKTIIIPASDDLWDPVTNTFRSIKEQKLVLEHSLISLSKWERITKKPFLQSAEKKTLTSEEWLLYIKCMTLNNVNDEVYNLITLDMFKEIMDYINDPMTATTIRDFSKSKGKREIVTSEIIYYNMISYGIPIELEKWHLNNLTTLISVFSIKGGNQKKMSTAEANAYQHSINKARRGKRH